MTVDNKEYANGWIQCSGCTEWVSQCGCDLLERIQPDDLEFTHELETRMLKRQQGREVLSHMNHIYTRRDTPVLVVRQAGKGYFVADSCPLVMELTIADDIRNSSLEDVVRSTVVLMHGHVLPRHSNWWRKVFYMGVVDIFHDYHCRGVLHVEKVEHLWTYANLLVLLSV